MEARKKEKESEHLVRHICSIVGAYYRARAIPL